jgi:hypothetical protein
LLKSLFATLLKHQYLHTCSVNYKLLRCSVFKSILSKPMIFHRSYKDVYEKLLDVFRSSSYYTKDMESCLYVLDSLLSSPAAEHIPSTDKHITPQEGHIPSLTEYSQINETEFLQRALGRQIKNYTLHYIKNNIKNCQVIQNTILSYTYVCTTLRARTYYSVTICQI